MQGAGRINWKQVNSCRNSRKIFEKLKANREDHFTEITEPSLLLFHYSDVFCWAVLYVVKEEYQFLRMIQNSAPTTKLGILQQLFHSRRDLEQENETLWVSDRKGRKRTEQNLNESKRDRVTYALIVGCLVSEGMPWQMALEKKACTRTLEAASAGSFPEAHHTAPSDPLVTGNRTLPWLPVSLQREDRALTADEIQPVRPLLLPLPRVGMSALVPFCLRSYTGHLLLFPGIQQALGKYLFGCPEHPDWPVHNCFVT